MRLRQMAGTGISFVGSWSSLTILAVTVLNLAVLLLGTILVLPHLEGRTYLFVITPFLVPILDLTGLVYVLWYIVLVIIIILCVWWTIQTSRELMTRELMGSWTVKEHSPAFLVGTMWFALLALNILIWYAVRLIGEPNTPGFADRPLWETMYSLAHASVWEEIVSRVLLIGVPLLFLDTILHRRNIVRRRELSAYFLGGGFKIGEREAYLMILSATMFGLAHIQAWDLYKVLPAALGGLFMAFLFLKVGLWASITFHFANNFLTMWTSFLGIEELNAGFEVLTLAWILVGLLFVAYYASWGLSWFRSRSSVDDNTMEATNDV